MKSLKDEIGGNLDNFNRPMAQAFRNMKDDIVDGIGDALANNEERRGDNSQPRKKGCIWTVIKWYLVLALMSSVLSECGTDNTIPVENDAQISTQAVVTEQVTEFQETDAFEQTEGAEYSQLSFVQKQREYAADCNIELHRFSRAESELFDWIEHSNEKIVYLELDNIFGADQYKRTEDRARYLYYGELKENRPDGYGVLLAPPKGSGSLVTYEDRAYVIRYIGQFTEGRFDGFGLLFEESENGYAFLSSLYPDNESTGEKEKYYFTWVNYVEYYGEFSKGYRNGRGNSFLLSDFYAGTFETALSEVDLDNPSFSIVVGEYKNDVLNGSNKQYIGGYLYYDGESRDNMFDGYGVLYYYGTDIPAYKGEFKNDMRHGAGTSYNETGEVEYEGEWENDDYA